MSAPSPSKTESTRTEPGQKSSHFLSWGRGSTHNTRRCLNSNYSRTHHSIWGRTPSSSSPPNWNSRIPWSKTSTCTWSSGFIYYNTYSRRLPSEGQRNISHSPVSRQPPPHPNWLLNSSVYPSRSRDYYFYSICTGLSPCQSQPNYLNFLFSALICKNSCELFCIRRPHFFRLLLSP